MLQIANKDPRFMPKVRNIPKSREIIREVSELAEIPIEALVGSRGNRRVSGARQYAMWRVYREVGCSLIEVGRLFNRDHTTALYAVNRIESTPGDKRLAFLAGSERERAQLRGALTYFGQPCPHGHGSQRYVTNGQCIECARLSKRWARRVKDAV